MKFLVTMANMDGGQGY